MDNQSAVNGLDPALRRFAHRLQRDLGAERVLLFGSYARGSAHSESDYELIIVSPRFREMNPLRRSAGLRRLFYSEGGYAPMDLICLTPEEFELSKTRASLVAAVLPEAVDLLDFEASPV